ncbi:hypothetical protein BDV93DRAFT_566608 [Ceratobasidium sp. AG-I]|nr:hypothetical protein BDV93DRAFT_566608 [Ceratobasidium sp. AG-I]
MASPLRFPVSDDEVTAPPRGRVAIPRQPGVRQSHKRSRANSSPLADEAQVFHDRSATPFAPASTRDPSPAPTEQTLPESTSSGVSEVDSTINEAGTTKRHNKTALNRANMDAEVELVECLLRITKSGSPVYKNFHSPTVVYKQKGRPTHNGFRCRYCGQVVERPIGVSYTSSLASHSAKCGPTTQQSLTLDAFGVTGGTPQNLTPEQVREFFALWTAESARPFCILQKLLHPDARKYQPHRDTIGKDIRRMYQATQGKIAKMLEIQEGIFHLALDMFQSSNGLDFLGIVLFCHLFTLDKPTTVERFVLECVRFDI